MTQPDLNNLRALLEGYERYADSIEPGAAGRAAADMLKAAIAEARAALRPSGDGTANFVDTRAIIERLDALEKEIEAGQAG